MSDMGTFRTEIDVESPFARGRLVAVPDALVDTGSEFTWVPAEVLQSLAIPVEDTKRFATATGERVERDVCYAIVHAAGVKSIDEVVFALPGDMTVLGAHSLEGLNLRVDPRLKQLMPAGPILAGAAG
jgi:predicted aspartyl protease